MPESNTLPLTDNDIDVIMDAMRDSGRTVGGNMANWVDIDERNAQHLINLIDNCELADHLCYPNLSGEFADDPTPQSLTEEISAIYGLEYDEIPDWLLNDACSVWEQEAALTFESQIIHRARYYLAVQS